MIFDFRVDLSQILLYSDTVFFFYVLKTFIFLILFIYLCNRNDYNNKNE